MEAPDIPRWHPHGLIAATAAGLHAIGCLGLVFARGGTELAPAAARQPWILSNRGLWTLTWVAWVPASFALVAFCAAWSRRLKTPRVLPFTGFELVLAGLPFDLAGEALNIIWLGDPATSPVAFAQGARFYQWLGPGIANGLYSLGGLWLSVASWKAGLLRGPIARLGFAVWGAGILLTASVCVGSERGMILAGGALMLLFIPWVAALAWRWRR